MTLARGLSRSLGLTVSTTTCVGLRKDPYKFRLGLVYDYLVEYESNEEVEPDLIGIENAVAYGVAAALDECDDEQSPLYAVELASRHKVFEDGFCAPVDHANECQVIRGYTEIRLDSIAPTVELAAYSAIESVLHEPLFLNQFVSMPYARVDFVRSVDQVLETNEEGSDQHSTLSWVAIAAAILSFAFVGIFFAGFWRKQMRSKARRKKKKNLQVETPIGKKRFLLGSAPRKYYELDEEAGVGVGGDGGSGFKMVEILEPGLENPSVTWSISDITSSESGSILSNLSRTTSKLERIEEEDNESQTDDEWDGNETYDSEYDDDGHPTYTGSIPLEYLYDISAGSGSPSPRHHVDAFDYALEEGADPAGCRYIEDSSDDDDEEEEEDDDDNEMVPPMPVNYHEVMTVSDEYNVGFDPPSVDTVTDAEDEEEYNYAEDPSCPSLSSLLNSSDDTVETSNESRAAVLYESTTTTTTTTLEDEETEEVQKWLIELVKELRKAQHRKLLTYNQV